MERTYSIAKSEDRRRHLFFKTKSGTESETRTGSNARTVESRRYGTVFQVPPNYLHVEITKRGEKVLFSATVHHHLSLLFGIDRSLRIALSNLLTQKDIGFKKNPTSLFVSAPLYQNSKMKFSLLAAAALAFPASAEILFKEQFNDEVRFFPGACCKS